MGLMAGLSGLKDFAFLPPFRAAIELLITIPGISHLSAAVLVSEMGIDMSRFETAGHLLSCAGLCPSTNQRAGTSRSTRMQHYAPWLKTALIQCGGAATRKKDRYLQAQF